MGSSYSSDQIGPQNGKVVIVTGANTGIGRVTAFHLARQGAHVILACRSADRTNPVVTEIQESTGNDKVEFMELDLGSLTSVVRFTDAFRKRELPLHLLINNAGIMAAPYKLSADNIELQFATNHLGHFLLTTRLLDIIEASAPARIVNLSSMGHKFAYSEGVRFDKINDKDTYHEWRAYGQSKLCNILFTKELDRRLEGKTVFVNAVHPGFVATELTRQLPDVYGWIAGVLGPVGNLFAKSPEDGALTTLYVATHPDIESVPLRGQYFTPTAHLDTPSHHALDADLARRLWEYSEALVAEKLGQGQEAKATEDKAHSEEGETDSAAS
eukprot:TRINITY_DN5888_c0_g1_i2.p1 TRINITY_DN5888_c0_g1~~TRINITY_DN5888_c0_g1_i2.p1  ORF type:complete len:340 (-),score=46.44 TRINITY_DN5888_c0_g1_i2:96-1079(-)